MPQVWLTYEELAEMFTLDAETSRSEVIAHGWPRRRCSDALTRVKLPPAAAHEYMVTYAVRAGQIGSSAGADSPVLDLQRQAAALADELSRRGAALVESARKAMSGLTAQDTHTNASSAESERSAA